MIYLKKLSGKEVVINADLIEAIEATPDTVVTLVTGNRYVVQEAPETIMERVIAFRRAIFQEKGTAFSPAPFIKKDES